MTKDFFILIILTALVVVIVAIVGEDVKTKAKNLQYPGYSACSKCGGNWGWKKRATHMTSESRGLFLFCVDCDKIVTLEERWKALDEWKENCIKQMKMNKIWTKEEMKKYIKKVEETEFIEFPRSKL